MPSIRKNMLIDASIGPGALTHGRIQLQLNNTLRPKPQQRTLVESPASTKHFNQKNPNVLDRGTASGPLRVATTMATGTATPQAAVWGQSSQPNKIPGGSNLGRSKSISYLKQFAVNTPAGRALQLLTVGGLLINTLRNSNTAPASKFVPLTHGETNRPQRGYATVDGAGDALIHAGHTKPLRLPKKNEGYLAPQTHDIEKLILPGLNIPLENLPALPGKPAQHTSLPIMRMADGSSANVSSTNQPDASTSAQNKNFEYVTSPDTYSPHHYPLISRDQTPTSYTVPHELAPQELVQTPDGILLVNVPEGLLQVPDGEYIFASVRGRTQIRKNNGLLKPEDFEITTLGASYAINRVFSITQGLAPELTGQLRIKEGRITHRENLSGVIQPPNSERLYANRYPDDMLSGEKTWKLKRKGTHHYLLEDSEGKTHIPHGRYRFGQRPDGDIYVTKHGSHSDTAGPEQTLRFAGAVAFENGRGGQFDDSSGHFMPSQYHAQFVPLPGPFWAFPFTLDYIFGPPVNHWLAKATPSTQAQDVENKIGR